MKKKNGFIMVETIVCIAFLATSLIIVYRAFTNIVSSEKKRLYFDDPVYLYRTYYLLNYLEENNIVDYLEDVFKERNKHPDDYGIPPRLRDSDGNLLTGDDAGVDLSNVLVEFSCDSINAIDGGAMCKKLFKKNVSDGLEVYHVYLTYRDVTDIVDCVKINDNSSNSQSACKLPPSISNLSPQVIRYIRTLGGYGEVGYRLVVEYRKKIVYSDDSNYTNASYRYYYSSLSIPAGGGVNE